MDVQDIIKYTVEQSVTKAMRESLSVIGDKLVENFVQDVAKPKYSPEDILTEIQVAEYLQLSLPTLRSWRAKKQHIPYISISDKAVRYKFEDVLKYVISKKIQVI